jgi:hypothetical protein
MIPKEETGENKDNFNDLSLDIKNYRPKVKCFHERGKKEV